MIRVLLRNRCAPTLALLLALAGPARADFNSDIHYFDYSSTVAITNPSGTPPSGSLTITPSADNTRVDVTTPGQTLIQVTANRSIANELPPGTNHLNATSPAGTNVSFGEVAVGMVPTAPEEAVGFDFNFTLTVTDYGASKQGGSPLGTGTISVIGRLDGTVGDGVRSNLDVTGYATNPASGTFAIGANSFHLSDLRFAPPEPGEHTGRFTGHLTATPEPGSLVLMGLGGLGLAVGIRRRRAARVA